MNVSENQPQNLRGWRALVGIMGVLIILGTTVVVGTIIHRLYTKFVAPPTVPTGQSFTPPPPGPVAVPAQPPASASTAPASLYTAPTVAPPPPSAPLTLPPGTHIQAIAQAGAGLAILTTGPSGQSVLLLDPATGKTRTAIQSAP